MSKILPPVYALLTGDVNVAGYVANKVYPYGQVPSNDDVPYITWLIVTGLPELNLSAAPDTDRHTIIVNCWSKVNSELNGLASAVRDALETVGNVTDFSIAPRDPNTRLFLASIEFDWIYPRT